MPVIIQILIWSSAFFVGAYALSGVALYFGARRIIRKSFAERGVAVTKIEKFQGFADTGSLGNALTSAAYTVRVIQHDGKEAEFHCVIRYIPIIGYAIGIEIWDERVMPR